MQHLVKIWHLTLPGNMQQFSKAFLQVGSNQIITRVTGKFNFYTDGDYNMGGIEKLKDYRTKYDMTMIDDNPYDISILFDWDIKNEILMDKLNKI